MRVPLGLPWLLLSVFASSAIAQYQGGPPPPPPNSNPCPPRDGGTTIVTPRGSSARDLYGARGSSDGRQRSGGDATGDRPGDEPGNGPGTGGYGGGTNNSSPVCPPPFRPPGDRVVTSAGDLVPPEVPAAPPKYDGPATGAPNGGRGVGPAGPTMGPGAAGPKGQPSASRSARPGLDLTPPPDAWDLWWGANRERFLAMRSRIAQAPSEPSTPEAGDGAPRGLGSAERAEVAAHILAVLEGTTPASATEIDAALVAAGKLGVDPARTQRAIQGHLRSSSQTTRELAALSLGLLGDTACLPLLLALTKDAPLARAVSERSAIDTRTRAFAIYGLGLLARRPENAESAPRLAREALLEVLRRQDTRADAELATACFSALGVLPLGEHERWTHVYPALEGALVDASATGFVRAHVPTSLARLSGAPWSERFSVLAEDADEHPTVRGSALLALGRNAAALSPGQRSRALRALAQARERSAGFSERSFATLALGQLGSDEDLAALERELGRGVHLDQPWIALALGLAARNEIEQGRDVGSRVKALRAAFAKARAPETRGALAIALGLAQASDASADLRTAFGEERISRTRGYLALALGMIGDRAAIPAIRAALAKGGHDPEDVDALATSLGLLGDAEAVPLLLAQMRESKSIAELGGLAAGLGRIGEARTAEGLLDLARDAKASSAARTYALSALGMLFESGPLPWNALYAEDLNYFATTATLSGGSGVLDLL
ncbi:MAG: hypothetical protein JNM84_16870 [Planctomycetes bacterium]|nr:hypothetical protein [Planctomycetota bacterium]